MRGSWRTLLVRSLVATIAALALAGGPALAAKFKVLHSFCESHQRVCGDGSNPSGPLVMEQSGNFFGTAATGGLDSGAVFELERKPGGGFKFKTIYRFCTQGTCGRNPMGALVIDTQGNLYGTANNLVFELSPGGKRGLWTEKVIYQFCSQQNCTDGNFPQGGLTYAGASSGTPYDGVSPLYSVTGGGGANNGGTVFELTNNGGQWSENVLYSFCSQGGETCTDGQIPRGVIIGPDGTLYGITYQGGGNDQKLQGAGVAFELVPDSGSWSEIVLHYFCSKAKCSDGARPTGNLLLDPVGNLIGATYLGGRSCGQAHPDGCGVLFKIIPNGSQSQEAVLYEFCKKADCRDGLSPNGEFALTLGGDLLGTTSFGGGNDIDVNGQGGGVVFELSPDSDSYTYKVLHSFCSEAECADGEYPLAPPTLDASGSLVGTTSLGGEFGNNVVGGTVFQLKP